jgi:hypothetical protein
VFSTGGNGAAASALRVRARAARDDARTNDLHIPFSGAMSGPSTAAASPPPPLILHWGGDKHWLLVKEGVHTLLDRILLKEATSSRGLYSRLSRVEKRSAVLKYASALLQKEHLRLHRSRARR